MRSGFRFDPPEVVFTAELGWVFRRAFGPRDLELGPAFGLHQERCVEAASMLDLRARIGSRTPQELLVADVGAEAARVFHDAYTRSAVVALIVEQVCRDLADHGARLGIEMVLLKGAALQLDGIAVTGSRNTTDVDVLVTIGRARELQAALIESGCTVADVPESEHQLQFLFHPLGLGVEVHHAIPGLQVAGSSHATVEQLIDAGLVERAPGLDEHCFIPAADVTLAHVLVHGLAQHGMNPRGYPMTRMLADVQDFERDERGWAVFAARSHQWIGDDVSSEEANSVRELVRRLGTGEDPAEISSGEAPSSLLLRHVVAGLTNAEYETAIRLRGLAKHPTNRGRGSWLVGIGHKAVFLTRDQIDIIYGKPKNELGYLGRRLWRPFDLVVRACRYGWAALRHRRRQGRRREEPQK